MMNNALNQEYLISDFVSRFARFKRVEEDDGADAFFSVDTSGA